MERWHVSVNSYYHDASISREEAPFWVFWMLDISNLIGNLIPAIPFPKMKITVNDYDDNGNLTKIETTMADWYGDLNQLWFIKVGLPIFDWCYTKIKTSSVHVDLKDIPHEMAPWLKEYLAEDESDNLVLNHTDQIKTAHTEYLNARDNEHRATKVRSEAREKLLKAHITRYLNKTEKN